MNLRVPPTPRAPPRRCWPAPAKRRRDHRQDPGRSRQDGQRAAHTGGADIFEIHPEDVQGHAGRRPQRPRHHPGRHGHRPCRLRADDQASTEAFHTFTKMGMKSNRLPPIHKTAPSGLTPRCTALSGDRASARHAQPVLIKPSPSAPSSGPVRSSPGDTQHVHDAPRPRKPPPSTTATAPTRPPTPTSTISSPCA